MPKIFHSSEACHLSLRNSFYYGGLPTVAQREKTLSLLYQKLQANKWIYGTVIFFLPHSFEPIF